VIDSLLQSPDYADYFANKWTALLKNRRDDTSDIVSNFAFYAWVRDSLLANKPYDQFVRELLAATGTVIGNPPVAWYKRVKDPKQQIEDVAQLFSGSPHAMRPVPSPSVRTLEPRTIITPCRRSSARSEENLRRRAERI